jgi:hypothetical protein
VVVSYPHLEVVEGLLFQLLEVQLVMVVLGVLQQLFPFSSFLEV